MLVASVWLIFHAGLATAVPIVMEQYVALRAVLDGVGKKSVSFGSLLVEAMGFFTSHRLCSVGNEFYMHIQIAQFIVRLYNCIDWQFTMRLGRKRHLFVSNCCVIAWLL